MTGDSGRWSVPPRNLTLTPGQVHVWRIRLGPLAPHHSDVLSPDEMERAQRYRFRRDRDRFTASRVALRGILARYLGRESSLLRFVYSEHGRPSLDFSDRCEACSGLDFSLAHSKDRALLAVANGLRVGIDVERTDGDKVDEGMLQLACSPTELQQLGSLPHHEQVACFYQCWTRKEAYLKARGDGLILPMNNITVIGVDGHSVTLSHSAQGLHRPEPWSLVDLYAWPDFAAALVWSAPVGSPDCLGQASLRLWDWRPPV